MTDLFDRFDLGGLALPNRVVMAPMTRTRADENGRPTALMREYYVQRAAGGLADAWLLLVSEMRMIAQMASSGRHALMPNPALTCEPDGRKRLSEPH